MPRVKRSVHARKKRRTVLNRAKGYYGAKSRSYRAAKEQVQHSLQYMYRDRRNKKREIRRLWITRINAAARINGLSYSVFMNGLKKAGVVARPQGARRHGRERPDGLRRPGGSCEKSCGLICFVRKSAQRKDPSGSFFVGGVRAGAKRFGRRA